MDSVSSRSSGVPYDWLIPMQPSPSAETFKPCVPSVRAVNMWHPSERVGDASQMRLTLRGHLDDIVRRSPAKGNGRHGGNDAHFGLGQFLRDRGIVGRRAHRTAI